ncbi:MAG: tetratricopeptide repeat protein [Deltaproteobacteria bacterium]|nr:tetratricopeptide repeat protein [Deltaproteobacteria bacterium]
MDMHSRELQNETRSITVPGLQTKVPVESSLLVRPIERASEAIKEFDSELVTAWTQHATVLIKHREFKTAHTLLRHSLAKEPRNIPAISLLAICLEKSEKWEEAVKCRRALVRLSPTVENRIDLANLYYALEDDNQALLSYQEILHSDVIPETRAFEIFKNMGNILVRKGDFEAAEDCYNRAFLVDSKSDALLVNFGTLEINRDNLEAATERFRSALLINDRNDRAWVGLALAHRSRGDFELSWANLERALDLNPENRTALKLLVEWGVRDGRVQAASLRLESYLALDGEDAEMAFAFAKCLTLTGHFNEALLECERVVALDPEQEEALRLRRVLAERIVSESETPA